MSCCVSKFSSPFHSVLFCYIRVHWITLHRNPGSSTFVAQKITLSAYNVMIGNYSTHLPGLTAIVLIFEGTVFDSASIISQNTLASARARDTLMCIIKDRESMVAGSPIFLHLGKDWTFTKVCLKSLTGSQELEVFIYWQPASRLFGSELEAVCMNRLIPVGAVIFFPSHVINISSPIW